MTQSTLSTRVTLRLCAVAALMLASPAMDGQYGDRNIEFRVRIMRGWRKSEWHTLTTEFNWDPCVPHVRLCELINESFQDQVLPDFDSLVKIVGFANGRPSLTIWIDGRKGDSIEIGIPSAKCDRGKFVINLLPITWKEVLKRQMPVLREMACRQFLEKGLKANGTSKTYGAQVPRHILCGWIHDNGDDEKIDVRSAQRVRAPKRSLSSDFAITSPQSYKPTHSRTNDLKSFPNLRTPRKWANALKCMMKDCETGFGSLWTTGRHHCRECHKSICEKHSRSVGKLPVQYWYGTGIKCRPFSNGEHPDNRLCTECVRETEINNDYRGGYAFF